jgi:hypothetical protein
MMSFAVETKYQVGLNRLIDFLNEIENGL